MDISFSFLVPLIATSLATAVLGIQTFANNQYESFKKSEIYHNIEQKNNDIWNKVNRNKDVNTLGANTSINENELKIVSYKEGFVNEKISQYIKTTKKIFNYNVKSSKVTLNDGYIDVFAEIDDNKTISGILKPSESKKTLLITDVNLSGFGNLEKPTKTTLENFINLNKDFLSKYFSDNIEKIEVKKGEIIFYFAIVK